MIFEVLRLFEVFKDIAPFFVCIITFISLLFAQKFLLKLHRNNIFTYILALTLTIGLYHSFIVVFNLRRTDYFMDGVRFVTKYFFTFAHVAFIASINVLNIVRTISIQDIPALFKITEALITYIHNVDVSTCAYLALHTSYKFKRRISIQTRLLISKIIPICYLSNKAQQVNCVFNC